VHLITKIDESGTHGASPYMIMAGYTARLDQWNRFDIRWRKGLRKADLNYFHAKEHWKHPFTSKVIRLSDSNLLFGFVARMSESDYKKFYREGDWGGKAQPDSMCGLCFRYCLSLVLQQALIEFSSSSDTKFLNVPPDAPAKALRSHSLTRVPIFRCHVDERELGIFKKGYFTHIDLRRRYGAAKRDVD
jgi:hypothetical protein